MRINCVIVVIVLVCGFNFQHLPATNLIGMAGNSSTGYVASESEAIKGLIRNVLSWSDSKASIKLLPVVMDEEKGVYVGFDMAVHAINLGTLKNSGFFSSGFIDGYDRIIKKLDHQLRNKEIKEWVIGELPPFSFANGVNPWCLCQDNQDWKSVEIKIISLDEDKGELQWIWGNLSVDADQSWKQFGYTFRVVKEHKTWKVSYMEGFDYNGLVESATQITTINKNIMKLGAFSVSLSVRDLAISMKFYEKLGFRVFAGSMNQKYLIMKNENTLIGLFQGMFEGNILTFNPGWDENAQNLEVFDDVRLIQQQLKKSGLELTSEADETSEGPASVMLLDPDGNVILIDQHR